MLDGDLTESWRVKFHAQRRNAERRGIGWQLTFQQWLGWWGDDIVRRGRGIDDLCMQRLRDEGPYALGNIRKGIPKQNGRTKALMNSERKANATRIRLEMELDRELSNSVRGKRLDETETEDQTFLRETLGYQAVKTHLPVWG